MWRRAGEHFLGEIGNAILSRPELLFHPWRYLDDRGILSDVRDTIPDPAWEVRAH